MSAPAALTPLAARARDLAVDAHAGQVDKAGAPYSEHVLAVGDALLAFGETAAAAGYLHDVVEDTHLSVQDLSDRGYDESVTRVVGLLTRDPRLHYRDFIMQIATDPGLLDPESTHACGLRTAPHLAALVKLADNAHNSLAARRAALPESDGDRLAKRYQAARTQLLPAVGPDAAAVLLLRINPDLVHEIEY